jgi:hypothetical protein
MNKKSILTEYIHFYRNYAVALIFFMRYSKRANVNNSRIGTFSSPGIGLGNHWYCYFKAQKLKYVDIVSCAVYAYI